MMHLMMLVIHTENSTLVKKGREKEKEYDQIEQFLDFITAKNMETYTTYRIRYEKKSFNRGDKSYYSFNNQPKCPEFSYLLHKHNLKELIKQRE